MALVEIMKTAMNESINEMIVTVLATQPTLIEGEPEKMHDYDLICSIGFTGRLEGNVVALFKKDDAEAIVSKMLGIDVSEVSADVVDGIGEVLNMIAGGIKNRLDKENYTFDINIPTVVNGHELNVLVGNGVTVLRTMVYADNISFGAVLSFKEHEEGKEPSKFAARKSAIKSDALLKNLIDENKK